MNAPARISVVERMLIDSSAVWPVTAIVRQPNERLHQLVFADRPLTASEIAELNAFEQEEN